MLNMRIFADILSARMHVYMIRIQDIGIREQGYGAQGYGRRDCAATLVYYLQIVICDRIFVDCSPPIVRPKNCTAGDRAAD